MKRYPSRLGRAGAVRKRKGEVKEVNGHQFVVQQFYQIMRCALCSDLFSGAGAQCEGNDCRVNDHEKKKVIYHQQMDIFICGHCKICSHFSYFFSLSFLRYLFSSLIDCKYTCHRKCFEKVVTKCISKSKADVDPDEEKLNHRIPHRFEAFTNLSASWCCHCGYILPLGKKGAKRCTGKLMFLMIACTCRITIKIVRH